ncbi:type III pantothenate kinase [Megasphaera sp. UPII 135-E]|uniref:type III pantothenate kinase n=1 Tax=Megasphaera sp. UPII 135-E TaxID=1000569 RepID=UPI00021A2FED|nr:type III pantothenate kinase [Megasphaera sp. UPII 135-E]EGS32821.1 pantothenate kinase, type III [Megasphaera sp. UPII 135-E]MUP47966.1 type III pantothenate kinase [Veillonellaceae bacterium M2-8]
MLLVIDVGNTNIVLGVFQGEELLDHWRISTERLRTTDEYGVLIRNLFYLNGVNADAIDAIIISSVVPPVMPTLERMCQRYFGLVPLVIGPGVKTGMDIKYDNPREVGADRIVNAVGAYHKYGGPVIIIDFGTATTFCAVDKKGNYLGGAICPGIGISTEALVQRTAKLPRIEIKRTPRVICRNTVESMQAGVFYGFVGQVDGLISRIRKELGATAKVVATGGLAVVIAPATKSIDVVEPLLTLEGLRVIYERNR